MAPGRVFEQDPLCLRTCVIKMGNRISLEFVWVLSTDNVESNENSVDPDQLKDSSLGSYLLTNRYLKEIESVYHVIK